MRHATICAGVSDFAFIRKAKSELTVSAHAEGILGMILMTGFRSRSMNTVRSRLAIKLPCRRTSDERVNVKVRHTQSENI